MPNPRKCSRDDCPPVNINVNTTVQCHACKAQHHLPCFDVSVPATKLFVIPNIVFLCDECLFSGENSPKRKSNDPHKILRQSTLTSGRILTTPTTSDQNKKATFDQLRKIVDNLSHKIDVNTNTVASLKVSVDSMHTTVSSNAIQIDESLKKNDTEISSAAKTIVEKFDKFEQKQTYAQTLGASSSKQIIRHLSSAKNEQSSIVSQPVPLKKASVNKFKGRALISGTNEDATHNLGDPVVFTERRRRQNSNHTVPTKPKFAKSVYVTRLQPSVTVDGLKLFLSARMPEFDENQVSIRMLVKKDQDLSELSFVSFRIACTDNMYSTLGSASFWPSHIKMREFIDEPRKPRENADEKTPASTGSSSTLLESDLINIDAMDVQPKNVILPPVQPREHSQ